MKLTSLHYNLIIQFLIFCLLITLTISQQLPYKIFNYTESKLGDQNTSFIIADIKTYDDGTILVHIMRNVSKQIKNCSKFRGISFEQKLYIRLIFLNGTVKEIDPKLKFDPINSINYCLLDSDSTGYKINKLNNLVMYLNDVKNNNTHKNLVNPITIYPLQKPFILVTYVRTNNSSDIRTYEECGEIIDWDGNIKSIWDDNRIQLNANKKLGFIRFVLNKICERKGCSWHSWLWQHYSIDDNVSLQDSGFVQ
ncbi:hypothetical protein C2G38_422651 [Gigaspora rosea]|uniref:Uncharacterized protein n=1 Tax=Gigaspora rosea TaxID=44941 RepID=A0A397VXM9_9GLOM|nr:hypothetical protein C2G38_422651 [Gigaspora rosea]